MRVDHVSIAVNSIDQAFEFFQRHFPIRERNPRRLDQQKSGAFYWRDFQLGGFAVELIEDLPARDGFVTRFIAKHGEGFHHLSIEVNHLDPIVEMLRRNGVRVVDEQDFADGAKTAFISPRSAFGTLIQFWQVPLLENAPAGPAPDDGAHFDHLALAVKDVDNAIEFFLRYLPSRLARPPSINRRGDLMLANVDMAGFKLELMQSPAGEVGDDFAARFIERYGEGMHHVAIDVKDFATTLSRLKADGIRVVDERTNWRGRREFFISPRSAFGILIQVRDWR